MAVYEQPLNEKVRLFMRLTFLMRRFEQHLADPTPENCQEAIMVLLELYNLSSRLDVKNAALHVLDSQVLAVRQAEGLEGVDSMRAERVLSKLEEKSKQLYSFRGQLGQHLKTHNFLNILKQRSSIAGGVNGMDIPLFNYWLNMPTEERVKDLRDWVKPYMIAFDAIQLLMDLIYEGSEKSDICTDGGYYQTSLDARRNYQMISIELPNSIKKFPEVSAGKQRISVRFVDASSLEERGKQVAEDIDFKLTLYSL